MRDSLPNLIELPEQLPHQALDGALGTNREPSARCQIQAKNDFEAIQHWLNEYKGRETTFRSYQKEAERLLLWTVFQRKKPLSSLTREDLELYFNFLSDPKPTQLWCGPRGNRENRRGQPGWRPFIGPLGPSAKNTAISIVHSLFNYLIDACYLAHNPFALMRKRQKRHSQEENKIQVVHRILELDEWAALLETLEQLPESTPHERGEKERLRFWLSCNRVGTSTLKK